MKLTETCKTWGGPCCSAEELNAVLKKNPDNEKKIIKTELSFYVHTHKGDRLDRPELFKLSNIDTTIMLENLFILLTNEDNSASRSSVLKIRSDDSKNAADQHSSEDSDLHWVHPVNQIYS